MRQSLVLLRSGGRGSAWSWRTPSWRGEGGGLRGIFLPADACEGESVAVEQIVVGEAQAKNGDDQEMA